VHERLAKRPIRHNLGLGHTLHIVLCHNLGRDVPRCGLGALVRGLADGLPLETVADRTHDRLLGPLDRVRLGRDGQRRLLAPPRTVARHVPRVPLVHPQLALEGRRVRLDTVPVRLRLVPREGQRVGRLAHLPQPQPRGIRRGRDALDPRLETQVWGDPRVEVLGRGEEGSGVRGVVHQLAPPDLDLGSDHPLAVPRHQAIQVVFLPMHLERQ